ncbi:adenylate/guanylate cyclase domain-containing protein [Mesorhizobium sp.]|uniref:adenylate/guanylate cyclase domain-containing protein n=1 Tax=Mesorhizobium sp. TaxID=1871066 RepID=UPI000FE48A0A|nr:adenylate/guanylate cyclase domain-containing protein [Mesorhizobium sp.]RWE57334.1 MAG: adenylate/guanylate cyclase domain-containing protein [Mesorhizobium sp.]
MSDERIQRRLAAVMAADVVGYSRLMEKDEAGTLAALKSRRKQVLQPLVARHNGRVFKVTGDGVMVEFASAVNALQCAMDVQHAMATANSALPEKLQIVLRIGVNLGDVMVEGSDLYGDGVNIASRLETIAEPGGILISGTVYDHVRNKINVGFDDLGAQTLKNIAVPVRIYRVSSMPPVVISTSKAITDKPSIAVLPFTNMSSDPEQEYFADGLAEDLITDLSKVPGLLVIARNSTFAYKGKSVDIRSVARDLSVRFVLEGSVRREKARVRINAQLIDATDSSHLWADRFDRDLADVFLLQDEVVSTIVSALSGVLPAAVTSGTRRAASLEAYDLFVRGRALVTQSPESNRAAPPLLERAIKLDSRFADAHAWLAMSHHFAWAYWLDAPERHHSLALAAARRAVSLDPENAVAHAILGDVLIYDGKPDEGAAELATTLRINPNHADAWAFLGQLKAFEGNAIEGIGLLRNALRLNPHPPGWYYWLLGLAQYAAGQYADAVETLRHEATHRLGSQRILAASLARLGHVEEAREEARQFLALNADFSIQHWANTQPFRHEEDRQHFIDGYEQAGLPR